MISVNATKYKNRNNRFTHFQRDTNLDSPHLFRNKSLIDHFLVRESLYSKFDEVKVLVNSSVSSDHLALFAKFKANIHLKNPVAAEPSNLLPKLLTKLKTSL